MVGWQEGERDGRKNGKREKYSSCCPWGCYLHVWWQLKEIDPLVKFHLAHGVDPQLLVGIHRHQERPNVRLEEGTTAQ